MPVNAGGTFLLPKPVNSTPHLWVVLTDPDDGHPPHVAIVNLTSSEVDRTVVLVPGDHAFVKHETFIYYEDAKIAPAGKLPEAVTIGIASHNDDCSPELLERIQAGVFASPHCPPKIREYCQGKF